MLPHYFTTESTELTEIGTEIEKNIHALGIAL